MEAYSRITFAIPIQERADLEAVASREDRTVSQLVREGVRMVLREREADFDNGIGGHLSDHTKIFPVG